MGDERDRRCEACPFGAMAEAFAAAVAEKLCPKGPPEEDEELISPEVAAKMHGGKSRTWLDRRRRRLPWSAAIRERETRGYDVVKSKWQKILRDGAAGVTAVFSLVA